jgi:hypothetical protein
VLSACAATQIIAAKDVELADKCGKSKAMRMRLVDDFFAHRSPVTQICAVLARDLVLAAGNLF